MGQFLERKTDKLDAKGDAASQSAAALGGSAIGLVAAFIILRQSINDPSSDNTVQLLLITAIALALIFLAKKVTQD
jgi:hypothetical protein